MSEIKYCKVCDETLQPRVMDGFCCRCAEQRKIVAEVKSLYGEGPLAAEVLRTLLSPKPTIPATRPFKAIHVYSDGGLMTQSIVAWERNNDGSWSPMVLDAGLGLYVLDDYREFVLLDVDTGTASWALGTYDNLEEALAAKAKGVRYD
ncbi:hypothetical protein [Shimia aestuarii]|uniref:Uncharacterized protein n=1 Tax=Shimia aestuarii TaxID=254406 RepID=A0A1I4P0W4_9RHOB|nr:hypothetical protein [Shimia aestuarii]SFM21474.1 hypothetical protein SAMN04488042_10533 [Shimia aestuarii]